MIINRHDSGDTTPLDLSSILFISESLATSMDWVPRLAEAAPHCQVRCCHPAQFTEHMEQHPPQCIVLDATSRLPLSEGFVSNCCLMPVLLVINQASMHHALPLLSLGAMGVVDGSYYGEALARVLVDLQEGDMHIPSTYCEELLKLQLMDCECKNDFVAGTNRTAFLC